MKSVIEFATRAEMEEAKRLHPVTKSRTKPAYNDLVLNPDYQSRKYSFPRGQTCIRILPGIKGSPYWGHNIQVLTHPNGQHLHPKSLTPKAKSVFDSAYGWLRANKPETLLNKSNPEGFRLLPTVISICWILVEIDGEMKAKLFLGSAYDGGSQGGNCGVGHQLFRVASEINQSGHDAADAEDGAQIIVEKSTPHGAKYPIYKMTRGSVAAPISRYVERLSDEEYEALCPIRDVLRRVEPDEEWELLANVIGEELRDEIRNSTANAKPQVTPKTQPQPVEQNVDESSVAGEDEWRW